MTIVTLLGALVISSIIQHIQDHQHFWKFQYFMLRIFALTYIISLIKSSKIKSVLMEYTQFCNYEYRLSLEFRTGCCLFVETVSFTQTEFPE